MIKYRCKCGSEEGEIRWKTANDFCDHCGEPVCEDCSTTNWIYGTDELKTLCHDCEEVV
jgi:hypothetical protein